MDGDKLWLFLKPYIPDDKDNEKLLSILMPCFKEFILRPRFRLLAIVDSIFDAMKKEGKYEASIITDADRKIRSWVLRWDNKFLKAGEIPDEVDKVFQSFFNNSMIDLLTRYQNDINTADLTNRVEVLIKEWVSPKHSQKIITASKSVNTNQVSEKAWQGASRTQSYMMEGAKTVIDDDELQKIKEKVDLMNFEGISETIKNDQVKFAELFWAYEHDKINPIVFSDNLKEDIKRLWYGTPGKKNDINNFVEYAKNHKQVDPNFSLKIKNSSITPSVSRLILQAYLIGLAGKLNLERIFRAVLIASEKTNPEYIANPLHVYEKGNVPYKNVENIINEVFNGIKIPSSLAYIRTNWENLKNPKISTKKLTDYIKKKIGGDLAWEINSIIATHTKNQVSGTSIEAFANIINKAISHKLTGRLLTLKIIRENLTYED